MTQTFSDFSRTKLHIKDNVNTRRTSSDLLTFLLVSHFRIVPRSIETRVDFAKARTFINRRIIRRKISLFKTQFIILSEFHSSF